MPPPLPGLQSADPAIQAILEGQSALLKGVNELRANVVTRDALSQFYELQSEEMKVFVLAETAPLHSGLNRVASEVTALAQDAVQNFDRVGRLEERVEKFEGDDPMRHAQSRPDKHDVANLQISFKGFTTETHDERTATLKAFMQQRFKDVEDYACIDHRMSGPSKSSMSDESFVQFFTKTARDRALGKIKDKNWGNDVQSSKGAKLTIGAMKTDWRRGRDWAMRKSETIIREFLTSKRQNGTVKYETSKDFRKITVNGRDAFVQRRDDPRGRFHGEFQDLQLP